MSASCRPHARRNSPVCINNFVTYDLFRFPHFAYSLGYCLFTLTLLSPQHGDAMLRSPRGRYSMSPFAGIIYAVGI